jgi:uncharacterized protein (TIRG00374 family)
LKSKYRRYTVFVLGIFLFVLVIYYSDIQKDDFFSAVKQVAFGNFIILSSAYVIAWCISSWRWYLLVNYFLPGIKCSRLFYLYTLILGQFSAYIVFKQLATIGSKSLCLGREIKNGAQVGLISSVIEVSVTCLVIFLMALVSVTGLMAGSHQFIWAMASFTGFTLLFLANSNRYLNFFLQVQFYVKKKIQKYFSTGASVFSDVPNILPGYLTGKVFLCSLCIYLIAVFRCGLILVLLDYDVDILHFILLCPLVIFVSSLGLTPGGFGVLELSWIGILSYLGLSVEEGTIYALVKRVADDGILISGFIVTFIYYETTRDTFKRQL